MKLCVIVPQRWNSGPTVKLKNTSFQICLFTRAWAIKCNKSKALILQLALRVSVVCFVEGQELISKPSILKAKNFRLYKIIHNHLANFQYWNVY